MKRDVLAAGASVAEVSKILTNYANKLVPRLAVEVENYSKWQIVNPSVDLESSELKAPAPIVIAPGSTEAFLAIPRLIVEAWPNMGTISWDIDAQVISISWYIQWKLASNRISNHFKVCVNGECDIHEYDEEHKSNCACQYNLCISANMGTHTQTTAKVAIYPLNSTDYAGNGSIEPIPRCESSDGGTTMPPKKKSYEAIALIVGLAILLLIILIISLVCKIKGKCKGSRRIYPHIAT